ncbi:MAG: hypothetical protein HYX41_06625 [Bdellovibrio sp.]|nr:hypothetical protein [Bdellovibrio sp.]
MQKITQIVLPVLGSLVSSVVFAHGALYSSRPQIQNLASAPCKVAIQEIPIPKEKFEEARKFPGFDEKSAQIRLETVPCWGANWDPREAERFKAGVLEFIAEILEFFPDYEYFVMGRDAEPIFDEAVALTHGHPKDTERFHLILTSRTVLEKPHFSDYLRGAGMEEIIQKKGRRILFIDYGYAGTAAKKISGLFPKLASDFDSFFLFSLNPRIPFSRVFWHFFNPSMEPSQASLVIALEGMPPYFNSGEDVLHLEGKWEATCSSEKVDLSDPAHTNRHLAEDRIRDIKYFSEVSANREHFEGRRSVFRKLYDLAKKGATGPLNAQFAELAKTEPVLVPAIKADLFEILKITQANPKLDLNK